MKYINASTIPQRMYRFNRPAKDLLAENYKLFYKPGGSYTFELHRFTLRKSAESTLKSWKHNWSGVGYIIKIKENNNG